MLSSLKRSLAVSICASLIAPSPSLAAAFKTVQIKTAEVPVVGAASSLPSIPAAQPVLPAASLSLPIPSVAGAVQKPVAVSAAAAQPKATFQAAAAGHASAAASSSDSKASAAGAAALDSLYTGAAAASGMTPTGASSLATQLVGLTSFAALKSALKKSFAKLPLDQGKPGPGRRYRAAAELEVRPLSNGTLSIKATPGATFLNKDAEAKLSPISPEVILSPEFKKLVETLYSKLPEGARANGVRISVHQMRVQDGTVTEGPHQDPNADYLAIWAVDRKNAAGGETVLSTTNGQETFRKTLGADELVLFDNRTLLHDATPLKGRRDALVFAISSISAAAAALSDSDKDAARQVVKTQLSKTVPDAAALKTVYRSGEPALLRSLYRGFKRWSRFFSVGDSNTGDLWKLVKGGAAPWAGHVYVKKLTSVLEFLNKANGNNQDAEKTAQRIHELDHAFSDAFVKAAEQKSPQGLDEAEAAEAISDSVIFPAIIEPFMDRRLRGPFDRKAVLGDVAKRLKDTVYLYSSMSLQDIEAILGQPDMLARLDDIMDAIEEQMPEDPRGPTSSSAAKLPAKKSRRMTGGGSALALLLMAGGAALQHFFGFGAELTAAAPFLAIGALSDANGQKKPAAQANDDGEKAPPKKPGEGPAPFLIDLTQKARRGELDPIYLRDDETASTIQILNQKKYNNVVLIGEPGVGKTAIAEGLAQRIAEAKTGTKLDGQRVLLLDIGKFMAMASGSPDAFAAAVEEVVREAADGNTTLFIDEAHQLARDPDQPAMGMGSFFDQIKPVMTQGRLKLILATTREEYNRFFARDRALESRSQIVEIHPVAEGPAMELLYRIRGQFEQGVSVSFGAAKAAVELTVRAFRFDALLRMAIKAMDTAATRLSVRPALVKRRLLDTRKDILYFGDLLRQARAEGDLERQENIVPQLNDLIARYAELEAESLKTPRTVVAREDVAEALAELGAPVHSLKAGTLEYIENIEKMLRKNLIGHESLITKTVEALKRRFAQPDLRKPIFSAVLLGPTGTGKTEFVRLLARALFNIVDVDKGVIKIDGGEHQHKHDISRIQGSPPGYVGFGATETLMDQVRRHPESIILVDEVEKMHPDILNLFLGILEDGSAKDSLGRRVDFSHTVIVFTSNYGVPPGDYEKLSDEEFLAHVKGALKAPFPISPFRPELLNRPSLVDIFTPLKKEEVKAIVELRLSQLESSWKKTHGIELVFPNREATVASLMEHGYDPRNGARPVNRAIDKFVETPLSNNLLSTALQRGDRISFAADWAVSIEKAPADVRAPAVSGSGAAKLLAERFEAVLAQTSTPLTMDAVDAVLNSSVIDTAGVEQRAAAPGAGSDDFVVLRNHAPNLSDGKLKEALASIKKDAKGLDFEPLEKAVKALVQKGKRLNLEAETRAKQAAAWTGGFEELERRAAGVGEPLKAELLKQLQELVGAATKEREVRLSWTRGEDSFVVRVETDARLTYEEEDKLLELFRPTPEGRLEQAKDGSLDQSRQAVAAAGGRLGYDVSGGKTVLWLELPASKKEEADAYKIAAETVTALAEEELKVEAPQPAAQAKQEEPAPANIAKLEPPPGSHDGKFDADRQVLFKQAAKLTDANMTEREVKAIVGDVTTTLRGSPHLASAALEKALWNGLSAFVKYVEQARADNHQQLEGNVFEKNADGKLVLASRYSAFFSLYRALMASRPDLAPDNMRTQLAEALDINRKSRSRYYTVTGEQGRAVDAGWRDVVEIAWDLSARHPTLVSEEWLLQKLADDERWPVYMLERDAAVLNELTSSEDAVKAAAARVEKAVTDNSNINASFEEALARPLAHVRTLVGMAPTVKPWPGAVEAARLYHLLAAKRPELVLEKASARLKDWLALDEKSGEGAAWLVDQAAELGLALERNKPGSMPWKELAAKLAGDSRWVTMALVRHASILRTGGSAPEAVVDAANALREALEQRPQDASKDLEAMLWTGIEEHLRYQNNDDRSSGSRNLSQLTLVGGKHLPIRRVRELYELYGRLIAIRPDLIPAEAAKRLDEAMKMSRIQEWHPSEGLKRRDRPNSQAAHWTLKQLTEFSVALSASRKDVLKLNNFLDIYDRSLERKAEGHSFHIWDSWAIVFTVASEIGLLITIYGNDVPWSPWTLFAPAVFGVWRVSWAFYRGIASRAVYQPLHLKLRAELLGRMKEQAPIHTLRLIGRFDQEKGVWLPQKGRAELFKDLMKWPDFAREVQGKGLGKAVEGDEARFLELAETLVDVGLPTDKARDAAQRLEASLREHPDAADAKLEEILRKAVDGVVERVKNGKEDLAAVDGRPAPSLRSRNIVSLYQQLLALRPALAVVPTRALLHSMMSAAPGGQHRSAAGWLQEQGVAIAAGLDVTRQELLSSKDHHSFYQDSFRTGSDNLDGFRSADRNKLSGLWAWLGGAALFVGAVPQLLWAPAGFWFWVTAILATAGALVFAPSFLLWMAGRLRARSGVKALDSSLETLLVTGLKRGTPKAALDMVAELDADKEVWFPKPGHRSVFERLQKEWPEFKAAAATR